LKLERINDKQIKCTFSKEDLEQRHILPSELRYGSNATKKLFTEVLKTAKERFNFTQEQDALSIEAIPEANESISLLITKDSFPDELDTRFAEFSKSDIAVPVIPDGEESSVPTFDPSDLYKSFVSRKKGKIEKRTPNSTDPEIIENSFLFESMEDLITVAKTLSVNYKGESTLSRFEDTNELILDLRYTIKDADKFDAISATLADFDTPAIINGPAKAAIKEHGETVIASDAIAVLSSL
jgi:adapter protein MecA 1/2